jgi:hypothetical protein
VSEAPKFVSLSAALKEVYPETLLTAAGFPTKEERAEADRLHAAPFVTGKDADSIRAQTGALRCPRCEWVFSVSVERSPCSLCFAAEADAVGQPPVEDDADDDAPSGCHHPGDALPPCPNCCAPVPPGNIAYPPPSENPFLRMLRRGPWGSP